MCPRAGGLPGRDNSAARGRCGAGSFTFTSPRFVLPETTAGEDVAIEQPFELTDSSLTLPDGTQVSVDGGGVATARFSTFEDAGQTLYFLEDITFTFEK